MELDLKNEEGLRQQLDRFAALRERVLAIATAISARDGYYKPMEAAIALVFPPFRGHEHELVYKVQLESYFIGDFRHHVWEASTLAGAIDRAERAIESWVQSELDAIDPVRVAVERNTPVLGVSQPPGWEPVNAPEPIIEAGLSFMTEPIPGVFVRAATSMEQLQALEAVASRAEESARRQAKELKNLSFCPNHGIDRRDDGTCAMCEREEHALKQLKSTPLDPVKPAGPLRGDRIAAMHATVLNKIQTCIPDLWISKRVLAGSIDCKGSDVPVARGSIARCGVCGLEFTLAGGRIVPRHPDKREQERWTDEALTAWESGKPPP